MTRATGSRALPNLGAILGPNKSGQVARPRPAAVAAPESAQQPHDEGFVRSTSPAAAERPEPVRGKQVHVDADELAASAYLVSRSVYLPRSVHRNVSTYARQQETTLTVVLLTSVNATHSELGYYFAADAGPVSNAGDLFVITQKRRRRAEASVQTTIRLSDAQLAAIDDLAKIHNVDRSKLLTTTARLYLMPLMPNAPWPLDTSRSVRLGER